MLDPSLLFQLKKKIFFFNFLQGFFHFRSSWWLSFKMKVYIDGVRILVTALITYEGMNSLYRKGGGELQYIEGSRTYDTLRYGHKDGNLPFITRFRDRYNHEWNVEIENYWDSVNVFIPCGTQMLWYGADESPTRTGSDAQTQWAQVEFSYQGSSSNSNNNNINNNNKKIIIRSSSRSSRRKRMIMMIMIIIIMMMMMMMGNYITLILPPAYGAHTLYMQHIPVYAT